MDEIAGFLKKLRGIHKSFLMEETLRFILYIKLSIPSHKLRLFNSELIIEFIYLELNELKLKCINSLIKKVKLDQGHILVINLYNYIY